jgi:hypothetical protein
MSRFAIVRIVAILTAIAVIFTYKHQCDVQVTALPADASGGASEAPLLTTAAPTTLAPPMKAATAAAVSSLVPPAGGRASPRGKQGVWNGVEMRVETKVDDHVAVGGRTIESIDVHLRHNLQQRAKRIAFLEPQMRRAVAAAPRRVWIDVGARFYPKGSTAWFAEHYHGARSFEAVCFELLDLEATYPASIKKGFFRKFEFIRAAAWTHGRGVVIKGVKMGRVLDEHVDRKLSGKLPEWKAPSVDLGAYLLANFTKADFVVLKMDIEGGEWVLLPHLLSTGALDLVDELMLECHPQNTGPPKNMLLHQSCIDFINHFRSKGVFAHDWI